MVRYNFDLCERVLDEFLSLDENNSPEQFGDLVYEATMLPLNVWGMHDRERQEKRTRARKIIFALNEGRELIKMEERYHYGN